MKSEKTYVFWKNKKITIYAALIIFVFSFSVFDSLQMIQEGTYTNLDINAVKAIYIFHSAIMWLAATISLIYFTVSKFSLNASYIKKGLIIKRTVYWSDVNHIKLINDNFLLLNYSNNKFLKINIYGIKKNYEQGKEIINQIDKSLKLNNKPSIDQDLDSLISKMIQSQKTKLLRKVENSIEKNSIIKGPLIAFGVLFLLDTIEVVKYSSKLVLLSNKTIKLRQKRGVPKTVRLKV